MITKMEPTNGGLTQSLFDGIVGAAIGWFASSFAYGKRIAKIEALLGNGFKEKVAETAAGVKKISDRLHELEMKEIAMEIREDLIEKRIDKIENE